MYNAAISGGRIVKNSPNFFTFSTSGSPDATKTLWVTGGREVVGTAQGAPGFVQITAGGAYYMCLIPTCVGPCYLAIRNTAGDVLAEGTFESLASSPESYSVGFPTKEDAGYGVYWPQLTQLNPTAIGTSRRTGSSGGTKRAYLSTGKYVIPYTGVVVGISILARSSNEINTKLDELYFFNADPTTGQAYGRSDDLTKLTPIDNAWDNGDNYKTLIFRRPVSVKAGEAWGLWANDTTFTGGTTWLRTTGTLSPSTASQVLKTYAGDLSFTGSNVFVTADAPLNEQPQIKLLMTTPVIAIGGLSFYAGSNNSTPPTANRSGAFNAANDPATLLGQLMGVPCVNLAWGGSEFPAWLGPTGYFETIVTPMKPSVFLFGTTYNDAVEDQQSDEECRDCLDELSLRCRRIGTTLVLIETHIPPNVVANETPEILERLERLRIVTNDWATKNGVMVLPSYFPMGEYDTGPLSSRRTTKQYGTDQPTLSIPNLTDSDEIHPTQTGRLVMVAAWADALKGLVPRTNALQEVSFDPNLIPASSPAKIAQATKNASQILLIEV